MLKKCFFIILLALSLSACTQDNGDEKSKRIGKEEVSIESKEGQDSYEEGQIDLPSNDEEWLASSEESKWYEKHIIDDTELADPIVVDFEGDSIPEVVIPYSPIKDFFENHHGYLIGKYDSKSGEWGLLENYQLEIDHYTKVEAVGKLLLDDDKQILVTEELLAGASRMACRVGIYRFSEDENKLILASNHYADVEQDVKMQVDGVNNLLDITSDGIEYQFQPQGENWLVSNSNRIYLRNSSSIFKEPFIGLIADNEFFETAITFEDGFEDAKVKTGEPLVEDYLEGGYCAFYNNFYFCNDSISDDIVLISLLVLKDLTIEDFEAVLGQPDEGSLDEMNGVYSWGYDLGTVSLTLSSESEDPNGKIEMVYLWNKETY